MMKTSQTIYISPRGDDRNSGGSPEQAFRTLYGAKQAGIASGTTLMIEGGAIYEGFLVLENLTDITIRNYGTGIPVIRSGSITAITLTSCSNIVVFSLKLKGLGYRNCNGTSGISASGCENLDIINVEAMNYHKSGISAIACRNVKMKGCFAHDNGAVGISTGSVEHRSCENVYIAYCRAYDNAGDFGNRHNHSGSGIVISGTSHCIVEFCEAAGNGWAQRQIYVNGPVGIWCCCGCDDVVFRYNIARYNRTQPGAVDGDGLDIDGEVCSSVMEFNYTYGNEGSGYLLCEFWGDCSETLWENNSTRYCVSVDDDTRIGSYGAIAMSSPQDIPFDKMYIHDNFLVAHKNRHAVYNRNIPVSAQNMEIYHNVLMTDGMPAIQSPENPAMRITGNHCFENSGMRDLTSAAAPLLTEPRDLQRQPVFELLRNGQCDAVLESSGPAALFIKKTPPKNGEGIVLMHLMLDGPDMEGCDRSGDVSLYYDSIGPGIVTALRGDACEISTPLAWWEKDKRYILQAKARLQSPDVRAYLFLRDEKGIEVRAYFGGNSTGYGIAEIEFTGNDKWSDAGKYAGVALEGGEGGLYAESIKFIEIGAENPYRVAHAISVRCGAVRLIGDCYDTQDGISIMHGGAVEITMQPVCAKKIVFDFSMNSADSEGIVYALSKSRKVVKELAYGKTAMSLDLSDFDGEADSVTVGVRSTSPDGGITLRDVREPGKSAEYS